ncbi:putative membrane protein [Trichinella spiralis]|uniref:Membrane protein n=1 Tax=Trichinella spiralis TaxID=6334 RepID=A0ABR3KS70_TRISP
MVTVFIEEAEDTFCCVEEDDSEKLEKPSHLMLIRILVFFTCQKILNSSSRNNEQLGILWTWHTSFSLTDIISYWWLVVQRLSLLATDLTVHGI